MAYTNRTRRRTTRKTTRRKKTEIEKLAYKLGKISNGLKNPNSRVSESYNNGCKSVTTKKKKPLF